MKYNVIYVGNYPPQQVIEKALELGSYIDYATLTFQNALISGLDYWFPEMRIVSGVRIDTFPKVKQIRFKQEKYSHRGDGDNDHFVGVINLPLLKRICFFLDKRRAIKSMLKKDERNIVIMYSMPSNQLLAVATLRKYIYRTCLVVPDLPEFMSDNKSRLRGWAKAIDQRLITWAIKRIDTFALLSPYMAEKLPIRDKLWRQMEGMYKPQEAASFEPIPHDTKAILYTGNLGARYGIIDLLDAFAQINSPNYQLWIRGSGDTMSEIIARAAKDSRIKIYEPMEKDKLMALMQQATVLVNPVRGSQEFTRYFFPSKTMEYLASGTPVVMHHLGCVPSEYDHHIFYVENESVEGLRDKLVQVCEMDENDRIEHGVNAREFIFNNKAAIKQSKIVVDLVCNNQ